MMKQNAFTLIELMIVIAILGVLSVLIGGNFITSLKKGRDTQRKADLSNIQKALEMYYEDKKIFPTITITFGSKLCETASCASGEKVYMQKVPNDPISSKTYEIAIPANGSSYKLYACFENTQQILPYAAALTPGFAATCTTSCFNNTTPPSAIKCIYGISSSNTSP